MLNVCRASGCETLTLGALCLTHEPPLEQRYFPRGRPYRLKDREVPAAACRIEHTWPLAEPVLLRSSSPS
jgi:hypothetical protein